MGKTTSELQELLRTLKEPELPDETPSLAEQALQQQGNEPNALADEKARIQKLRNDRFENETDHWQTIYELRKEYIPHLFQIIVCWLVIVAMFVFLTGFSSDSLNNPDCRINCTRFKLSENILLAFITTTTATVLGLFVIVAKWLFPAPDKSDDAREKQTNNRE